MPVTRGRRLLRLVGVLAVPLALSSGGPARADDKTACVAATEQAQTLRDEGRYQAARAALVSCAREACPGIVRRDCEKWLSELDAAQPTLVLGARDTKGNDVAGTRVLLDGAPLVERLDGKPVGVDPGEHVLRYEAPGATPVEQRLVVRVGEKNRTLTAILMQQSAAAPVLPPAVAPAAAEPPASDSALARVPAAAWIFGGVALVAAGSFAYFGLSGQSDASSMRAAGGCAPDCSQGQVDSARTKLLVADVSLGVGVVALAAAAWFFLHPRAPRVAALDVLTDVQARPGGAVATIGARF